MDQHISLAGFPKGQIRDTRLADEPLLTYLDPD